MKDEMEKVDPAFVDEDGNYCLKGELFWRWRATDAEYQKVRAQLDHNHLAINALLTPELRALFEIKAGLQGQLQHAVAELTTTQKIIGETFKVDPQQIAIDDQSGRITIIAQDGNRVPVPPEQQIKEPPSQQGIG